MPFLWALNSQENLYFFYSTIWNTKLLIFYNCFPLKWCECNFIYSVYLWHISKKDTGLLTFSKIYTGEWHQKDGRKTVSSTPSFSHNIKQTTTYKPKQLCKNSRNKLKKVATSKCLTKKMAHLKWQEISWHFCSLSPHLLLMAVWYVGRKVTNFWLLPWDSKERMELTCNVLDCVGDAWSSGFFLTLLGAQMGMLA